MNGFEKHRVAHLSPSSLNLFAAEPAMWVMERLLGHRSPVGCAAHRGTASETGTAAGLVDPRMDLAECQAIGLAEFDRLAALSSDPKKDKERDAVPGIIKTALAELRQYGVPSGLQGKVVHEFPGLPPVLGFWDFQWTDSGITVDLKSQLKLSSDISPAHARQVALYVHNTNMEARVCYATPAKVGVYRLEDASAHMNALLNVAQRLGRFLAISNDPQELAGIVCPNFESFYWNPQARAQGRAVYGF